MSRDPTQNRLLDIAIDEFGSKGLEGASTRGIAAAAGTAMSSITYHYGGKEGLYLAAADRIAERLDEHMGAGEAIAPVADPAAARAELHRMVARLLAKLVSTDSESMALFIVREQIHPTEAFGRIYRVMGDMLEVLVRLVCIATGVRDAAAARIVVLTLFGQVLAIRSSRAACLRLLGVERIDDALVDDMAARIATNTDAILDRLAGERQEPSMSEDQKQDDAGEKPEDADDGGRDKGDAPARLSLFRRPLFWVILLAAVAIVAVVSLLWWRHARQFEATDDAFVDAHIVRISPTVAGQLTEVADVDNRHVEAGRLLAVIQAAGPQARLSEAQAGVAQGEAQLQQSYAQVDAAEADRARAAAQAREPLANAEKAAADLARYEALLKLDPAAVAGQQIDAARAAARSTAATAAAARRAVGSADAQVAVARQAIGAARAGIAARRAQVEQARVTIGDARLIAPVAGQVVNRQVNVGSYVAPGTQLMAIVPDRMWVTANFKETQLKLMKIGQPVTIKVDAFPDIEFTGTVDSIQRGAGQAFALLPAQNATGNFVKVVQRVPVRIEFTQEKGKPDWRTYPLGPGMSVEPRVKVR